MMRMSDFIGCFFAWIYFYLVEIGLVPITLNYRNLFIKASAAPGFLQASFLLDLAIYGLYVLYHMEN